MSASLRRNGRQGVGIGASRPGHLFGVIATWTGPSLPHGLMGPGGAGSRPHPPILSHRQQTGGVAVATCADAVAGIGTGGRGGPARRGARAAGRPRRTGPQVGRGPSSCRPVRGAWRRSPRSGCASGARVPHVPASRHAGGDPLGAICPATSPSGRRPPTRSGRRRCRPSGRPRARAGRARNLLWLPMTERRASASPGRCSLPAPAWRRRASVRACAQDAPPRPFASRLRACPRCDCRRRAARGAVPVSRTGRCSPRSRGGGFRGPPRGPGTSTVRNGIDRSGRAVAWRRPRAGRGPMHDRGPGGGCLRRAPFRAIAMAGRLEAGVQGHAPARLLRRDATVAGAIRPGPRAGRTR
jgi:hypothetical protein